MIIDDDDDYSLHHHHHHHQLPSAYLQLAGKTAQDSPPLSPSDRRTMPEADTLTAGCAYCAAPTPGVGPDCSRDRAMSDGDVEGSDGLASTCARCGHQHRVHIYDHSNSSDYVSGQHLHHCHYLQQQHDIVT